MNVSKNGKPVLLLICWKYYWKKITVFRILETLPFEMSRLIYRVPVLSTNRSIKVSNKSSIKELTLFTHGFILLPNLEHNLSSWKKQQINFFKLMLANKKFSQTSNFVRKFAWIFLRQFRGNFAVLKDNF